MLVSGAVLEELGLSVLDKWVCYYMTVKSKVRTDLGVVRAQVHVPGMIDVFCSLLVCLRDIYVKLKDE